MLVGVIADDFTGASDIASTLATARRGVPGFATTQFLGVPEVAAPRGCEAGVISLKTRSVAPQQAVAQSLEALAWLRAQGCRQIVFKYCSTFDSTPQGNIGPVGEALASALGAKGVVACPAFPATGRTLYQGNLFVGDVPLNESSLRTHPLNPMTDSDLRRWLRLQSRHPVGFLPWQTVSQGAEAIRAGLDEAAARDERLVIVDAISDDDLHAIGLAVAADMLVTGGSGIALGLAVNFAADRLAEDRRPAFAGIDGPGAILAGSCSQATLRQIARHAERHPVMAIDVERVMAGAVDAQSLAAFLLAAPDSAPLVYSSEEPERTASTQARHGREAVARALETLFADTARLLVQKGLRRLVVAGGETSGAVVSALQIEALAVGPEIAPGVPVLFTENREPLALALKSGNFGGEAFFEEAMAMLAGGDVR